MHKIAFLGHPVGHQGQCKKFCSRVSLREISESQFYSQNSVSEPPFGVELRGNVCDSSLAGWKTRSRLHIGYNCIFVASSYTTEALISPTSKSAFVDRGWSLWV